MKSTRRGFLGSVIALAAASAVVPKAEASEQDRVQALVEDVLANPGKHPEIEARAQVLTGRQAGVFGAQADIAITNGTTMNVGDSLTVTGPTRFEGAVHEYGENVSLRRSLIPYQADLPIEFDDWDGVQQPAGSMRWVRTDGEPAGKIRWRRGLHDA